MKTHLNGARLSGLGATVAALKSRSVLTRPAESVGSMTSARFAPNPGALEMLLHVPADLPEGAPLVVVLHGCTQTAAAYAQDSGWLTLADRLGFAVLAPQQSSANNPNRCFNWFQLEDMRRGDGEPASIAAMVSDVVRMHGLDAGRIYVTGLSAGGAMAAVMLAAYPDLFAGGAIIAGAPYGTARGVPQAFQVMQGHAASTPDQLAALLTDAGGRSLSFPPLTIWHGDADHVVNVANAQVLARQWAAGQMLNLAPDDVQAHPGYRRSVWRGPDGKVKIELNLVPGLGHGVPLETRGDAALGRAAPFMLQAGVNSTLEIARFWGFAPADVHAKADAPSSQALAVSTAEAVSTAAAAPQGVGAQVMASVAGVPASVQAVIADALTRAGLLK